MPELPDQNKNLNQPLRGGQNLNQNQNQSWLGRLNQAKNHHPWLPVIGLGNVGSEAVDRQSTKWTRVVMEAGRKPIDLRRECI